MAEKNYNIKVEDFTPLVGSFLYQNRNYKNSLKQNDFPRPYREYYAGGFGLTMINFASAFLIFEGLTKLLSK